MSDDPLIRDILSHQHPPPSCLPFASFPLSLFLSSPSFPFTSFPFVPFLPLLLLLYSSFSFLLSFFFLHILCYVCVLPLRNFIIFSPCPDVLQVVTFNSFTLSFCFQQKTLFDLLFYGSLHESCRIASHGDLYCLCTAGKEQDLFVYVLVCWPCKA